MNTQDLTAAQPLELDGTEAYAVIGAPQGTPNAIAFNAGARWAHERATQGKGEEPIGYLHNAGQFHAVMPAQADERECSLNVEKTSAEPEFIAAYMASCSGRDADHNEIGLHYFRAGWNARHPDSSISAKSAQARDAVKLPEPDFTLDEGETPCYYQSTLRAVLAKNGLGGKQCCHQTVSKPCEGCPYT